MKGQPRGGKREGEVEQRVREPRDCRGHRAVDSDIGLLTGKRFNNENNPAGRTKRVLK